MAISYVGGKGAGAAGQGGGSIDLTTGLAGGSGGAPIAGDLVIVTVCVGTAARNPTLTIGTPSGYTALTLQHTTASAIDVSVQTSWKFMGGTPDTAVTIPASGNNQDGIVYEIQVFRGVNPSSFPQVTPTYATGSGTDNLPDPAAILPTIAGSWIVVCGGGAGGTGGTYVAGYLTNFLTHNGPDTNDASAGCGYKSDWASGSYDPAAFTGGEANAANSWGSTTIVLEPITAPVVTTQAVSVIASATATGNGTVTADGGAAVTERGVCWNTTGTPTTSDSKATSGTGTGAFAPSMTGLSPVTHYYVRAYAINSVGTSYGSSVEFDTQAVPILVIGAFRPDHRAILAM